MELLDLWRLVGEGIAISFGRSASFHSRFDETGWLVSAGEPILDFNCALTMPGPQAKNALTQIVAHFRAQELPFLVCDLERSESYTDNAHNMGLRSGGLLPLMLLNGPHQRPSYSGPDFSIREAITPEDFRLSARLSQRCLGLPIESIGRAMPFDSLPIPTLRTLHAFHSDQLVATVSYTRQGEATGIWSLMTRPEFRRMGIGWKLMDVALRQIRADTAGPVFLVSTPEGKPLYERLGFKTKDIGHVWAG